MATSRRSPQYGASANFWDSIARILRWRKKHREKLQYETYRYTFKDAVREYAYEKRLGGVIIRGRVCAVIGVVLSVILAYNCIVHLIFHTKWGFGAYFIGLFWLCGIIAMAYTYVSGIAELIQQGVYDAAAADAYAAQYSELEEERRRRAGGSPTPPTNPDSPPAAPTPPPADPAPSTPAPPAAPTKEDIQAMCRNLARQAAEAAHRRNV